MRTLYEGAYRGLPGLRKLASETATLRGHWLQPWINTAPHMNEASCRNCGKEVTLNVKPAPNEIAIGGEAMALGCSD